jgi:hypothetical protein
MDYKFLDKVLDQMVSETRIDYDKEEIQFPFFPLPSLFHLFLLLLPFFSEHCKDIYGLNDDEIDYVWKEYRNIIIYKIKNNGL